MDNALGGYFKVRGNTPKTVVRTSGFLWSNTSITDQGSPQAFLTGRSARPMAPRHPGAPVLTKGGAQAKKIFI
jgi:hypothetical protein